ncbi:MAG: threonine ammonia-lyase [Actinomycetota bacterium]|nr:threonine ammonia-lyase [Actinomycetota bacterium]
MELVDGEQVHAAAHLLRDVVQTTPVQPSRTLSRLAGVEVVLKCENLQRTGSFKLRGAYHRIARLDRRERAAGVVCASAGNHAQGVALAARLQGVHAIVFMPEQAPLPKVEATTSYGAEVRLIGSSFDEALTAATELATQEGRVFVHPFDHAHVIAGQGTVGLELLEQVPAVGTVVVPLGGGGLVSGVAAAIKDARPEVRVIGVQASGAAAFPPSLAAGEPREVDPVDTIADGVAVNKPGALTLAHVRALVDEVATVDDDAIARALVLLLERAKLVVEPAGVVGVAALLAGQLTPRPPVAVVLSGGNIDPLILQHLVTSGLTAEGRYLTIRTRVADRPGELHGLLGLLAEQRANVVAIEHHRYGRRLRLEEVEVVIELETRGPDHTDHLRQCMRGAGYPFDVL